MRIIGGKFKGRTLSAPPGRDVRPTSDRAREGIFNILAHSIDWDGFDGQTVLDVFSGTGALGLEAMSRGANHGVFIDNDPVSLKCLRANAASLGEASNITPLKLDVTRLAPPPRITGAPLGLAFLDAPYGSNLTDQALLGLCNKGWIAAGGIVVVETGKDDELAIPRQFETLDARTYGAAQVTFLRLS
ncbi:MAG: 16S rRNA (guanine(966)-N(2))-methyltransferase RsmD [Rhodospirillaceae bacterium]|nr:16S rRNA (guanine(966)-N(2))-methyltransferase RsmD [Rhodospirillaceae bacterium]